MMLDVLQIHSLFSNSFQGSTLGEITCLSGETSFICKEKNCEGNICNGECCNFPKCVPATSTCDGVNDCRDKSDEGDFCQKNEGNNFLRFLLNSMYFDC